MQYTDKEIKYIADYLIKRDKRERLKRAEREAADGNNRLLNPFAPKIKEQSLHIRQQLTITDVMNSIAPSDKALAQELFNLGVNPNEINKIIIAQRPREFEKITKRDKRERFTQFYSNTNGR